MDLTPILSPKFLVDNVGVISLILAGFVLVVFDNFITRYAFKLADSIKEKTAQNIKEFGQKSNSKRIETLGAKYFSEALATAIILLYCYFGTTVLAEYFFAPILLKMRNVLLLVVIGLFIVISFMVNNRKVRTTLKEL